jgi:hypothetical protein
MSEGMGRLRGLRGPGAALSGEAFGAVYGRVNGAAPEQRMPERASTLSSSVSLGQHLGESFLGPLAIENK